MSEHAGELWRRPGPTEVQRRNDLLIGVGVLTGAMLFVVLVNSMGPPGGDPPPLGEQLLWAAAMTIPLCFRRRWPEAVVLLVSAAMIGAQVRMAAGDNQFASIAVFFALYTLGAWGRDRARARWIRVITILVMFGWLAISLMSGLSPNPELFSDARGPLDPLLATALWHVGINLLFFLSAYYFGNVGWESARREHELAVQAAELRRSQEENARRAVLDERVRIARDLHDVVAHNVSVMGIQASAARRVLDSDRSMSERCLRTVEDTARSAVSELRGLLGVLRSGEEPTRPRPGSELEADPQGDGGEAAAQDGSEYAASPGVGQLPDLVTELCTAGFTAEYRTFGEQRPVPDSIALSIYRVVQEAMTNVTKHAGVCHVDIRLRYLESTIEVEIADDGRGPTAAARRPAGDRGGYGLVGMRERVTVHGGELEAGPRRSGGFQVRARFPLEPALTPAGVDE